MTTAISFPMALTANGTFGTVDDTSPLGLAQQLADLVGTRAGERVMVQGYGIADPVFGTVTEGEIAAAVAQWGPAVTIDQAVVGYEADGTTETVTVTFT